MLSLYFGVKFLPYEILIQINIIPNGYSATNLKWSCQWLLALILRVTPLDIGLNLQF